LKLEPFSSSRLRYHLLALPLPERQLISRIRRQTDGLKGRGAPLITGIGDDCAVLPIAAGHEALVTTDFSIEGVHFRREWHPPGLVGHRCLTRGLSDIAAMGGIPLAAFLSLAVPVKIRQKWVDQFFDGFLKLANQFHVPLAGGDTSESPAGVLADVVVLGSLPRGKAVLRSGARAGHRIYVTGELGGSAATLDLLFSNAKKKLLPRLFPAHFFPTPRINIGTIVREKRIATAMIDISDGLSTDLSHLCEESRVGAEIWAEAVPCATIRQAKVDLNFALHGGEAYELLFTARPTTHVPARIAGIKITCIGEIKRRKKLTLVHADRTRSELKSCGWQHFRHPSPDK
jgi:thiamine-monophosphate kinase